ncbi:MAG: YceI family protein [Geminicoccaceae bacterium]|nr:YceI family protein [Geminicoccaceae bacterium]
MFRLPPAIGLLAVTIAAPVHAADTYAFDPAHTDIVFFVNHLGYSDTIGRFNRAEGALTLDQDDLKGSRIEVTIDAASLDTNHQQRDDHLRSADFFNVEEFPEITFSSTRVEPTGEKTATVTGDLTLLGKSRPVTLDVTLNQIAPHPVPNYEGVETAGFSARGTLKRSDFGMDFLAPAVGDEIELILEIEALKQDEQPS